MKAIEKDFCGFLFSNFQPKKKVTADKMAKRILKTIFGASKIYVIREIIHLSAIKVPMAMTIEAIASQKEYFDTLAQSIS